MSFSTIRAVLRLDIRLLRRDPAYVIIMLVMPLLVMAFLKPASAAVLRFTGDQNANGAEQAVPGMAVMFSHFLIGALGFSIFREHGWDTWDRLRVASGGTRDVMLAKVILPLAVLFAQLVVLLGVGAVVFHLHIEGSLWVMALLAAVFAACLVALGATLLTFCRSIIQLNSIQNLGSMVFAGLGGAIAPVALLPNWARAVAPVTPSYWAMRGFRTVILHGGGAQAVAKPITVLSAMTVVLAAVAAYRLSAAAERAVWA